MQYYNIGLITGNRWRYNMAGPGGARPGSGAKKGQHRITVQALRAAIEAKIGIKYEEMLAETQQKLFNDFRNDTNVKEYIMFTENMNKRILEQPAQEVQVTQNPLEELSDSDLQGRIDNLLTRSALSAIETDAQDGNEENSST